MVFGERLAQSRCSEAAAVMAIVSLLLLSAHSFIHSDGTGYRSWTRPSQPHRAQSRLAPSSLTSQDSPHLSLPFLPPPTPRGP